MVLISKNGYVHNFDVYTEKGSDSSEGTLGSRVVLMLSDHLKYKNHHLFFYFSKPVHATTGKGYLCMLCGKAK